jgi:hypothetical protein
MFDFLKRLFTKGHPMKLVRFDAHQDANNFTCPEGYGIHVIDTNDGKTQLTGVVYESDGSGVETEQVIYVPSSAVRDTIQIQGEQEVNATFTSTKFSRTITRRYIPQLRPQATT